MTHVPLSWARCSAAALAVYTPVAGEMIINTDDETLHVGDGTTAGGIKGGGSQWQNVGAVGAAAFANSWVNFGSPLQVARYRRTLLGDVVIEGVVKSGSVSAAIFTLPVGFRPTLNTEFVGWCSTGAYKLVVQSDGQVIPTSASATETAIVARFGTT